MNSQNLTNSIDGITEEKLLEIERQHPHYEPIMRYLLEEAFNPQKEPQYIELEEIEDWLNSLLD